MLKRRFVIKLISVSAVLLLICVIIASSASAAFNAVYIRGDADFNGAVNIHDAEKIQSLLIMQISDPDGGVSVRGDVNSNGLDITDATFIQRYVACYSNTFSIGAKIKDGKVISDPTEDSNELPEDIL